MADIKTNKRRYNIKANIWFYYTKNSSGTQEIEVELDESDSIEEYIDGNKIVDIISSEFIKENSFTYDDIEIESVFVDEWEDLGPLSPAQVMRRSGEKTLFDIEFGNFGVKS